MNQRKISENLRYLRETNPQVIAIVSNTEQGTMNIGGVGLFHYSVFLILFYVLFTSLPTLTSQEMPKNSITNLSPKEFKKKIEATKNAVLIDVRSRFEFRVGEHLEGAINTGMGRRVAKFAKANEKSTPVFVSCLSGHRSLNVCQQLQDLGFTEIYNLEGGLMTWKTTGMDLSLKLKE